MIHPPQQTRDLKVVGDGSRIGEKDIYESKGYDGGVIGWMPLTPPGNVLCVLCLLAF